MTAKRRFTRSCPLGAKVITNWDGSPLNLAWQEKASMPQASNGSMIFAWQNIDKRNNDGALKLTSGGSPPRNLDAPALAIAPSILIQNWKGNNLDVTNNSVVRTTLIRIQAYGPGLQHEGKLPTDGTPVPVLPGDTLTAVPDTNAMQLVFRAVSGQLALFAVIGGPRDASDNNAYAFAVNFPQAGPPPPGYSGTTIANSYIFKFTWQTSIFVAYFGAGNVIPAKVAPATVSLSRAIPGVE